MSRPLGWIESSSDDGNAVARRIFSLFGNAFGEVDWVAIAPTRGHSSGSISICHPLAYSWRLMFKRTVAGQFVRHPSSWRRMAPAMWGSPSDPTMYGTVEIDVTKAQEYLRRQSEVSGTHLTITHLVTKAVADTLAAHPECNAFIRRGQVFQRANVDVFVVVAIETTVASDKEQQADLTGITIRNADHKSLPEIAREIRDRAASARGGADREYARMKAFFDHTPRVVLKALLKAIPFVQYELNLDLSRLGIEDAFGSAAVTSLGMLGIDEAFPPITPLGRACVGLAVGTIRDKAIAENGRAVVRPMLPITAVIDHRILDGFQASRLTASFRSILEDPFENLGDAHRNVPAQQSASR